MTARTIALPFLLGEQGLIQLIRNIHDSGAYKRTPTANPLAPSNPTRTEKGKREKEEGTWK